MGANALLADTGATSRLIAELGRTNSPVTSLLAWDCASATDVGHERAHNEDSICLNLLAGILMVADGMGGYNAGEVASRIAIDHAGDHLLAELRGQQSAAEVGRVIAQAISVANTAILAAAARRPECLGMGTTLVAAVFGATHVAIGHAGDSRVYLLRNNHLSRLTRDHSVGQAMIDSGTLDEQGARLSSLRGVLTRALGVEPVVDADISELAWMPGDRFLVCSDGLTDMVDDNTLQTLLAAGDNAQACAQQLVQEALDAGGYDNVSVVVAFSPTPDNR